MSQEKQVHAFFNKPANYLHHRFGVRIRQNIVCQLLGPISGLRILDLGCGDGGVSLKLLNNNQVTFVDISEQMLELVKDKIPESQIEHAELVCSSVDNFRSDTQFDVVLAIGLVAHVQSISQFLVKVKKVLANKGYFLVQFSDSESLVTKLNSRKNRHRSYPLNSTEYGEFMRLMVRHGFKILEEVRYGLQWPGMGMLPDSWLYKYGMWVWKSGLGNRLGSEVIWKVVSSD